MVKIILSDILKTKFFLHVQAKHFARSGTVQHGHVFELCTVWKYTEKKTIWSLAVWKVFKCGVFSGQYFPAFGLNTERYEASPPIQSECGEIRTRKNSVFGHFSRTVSAHKMNFWILCYFVHDVVLMSLLLTLNILCTIFSIADFEHITVWWLIRSDNQMN